ncbi:MAG: hypothetical protein RIF46_14915 [Cyclobacteriaceae bacterium]
MKHGAEATARNRTLVKRYGRFSSPKNMFDQLKYRKDREGKLLKIKASRPELVEAVKLQMRADRKKSLKWELVIGIICAALFIGFVYWLIQVI